MIAINILLSIVVYLITCVAGVDIYHDTITRDFYKFGLGTVTVHSEATWSIVNNLHSDFLSSLYVDSKARFFISSISPLVSTTVTLFGDENSIVNYGLVSFTAHPSATDSHYNITGKAFSNNGEMYLTGSGDSDIFIDSDFWQNNGLLVFAQSKRTKKTIDTGVPLGSVTNNGQICLYNKSYKQNIHDIEGTGCITAEENSAIYIANPQYLQSIKQIFHLADSHSLFIVEPHTSSQVYNVAGFGGNTITGNSSNKISINRPIGENEWFYDSNTGILHIGNAYKSAQFKIGKGYNESDFSIVDLDIIELDFVERGAIQYNGPIPSPTFPKQCKLCKRAPIAPGAEPTQVITTITQTTNGVATRQTKSVDINTDYNGLFVYDFGETSVQLSTHTTTLAGVKSSIAKSEESSTMPASSLYHPSLLVLSHNSVEVTSAAETSSDHYWVEFETQPASDFITITSNYTSSSLPTESFSVILPHNSSEILLETPSEIVSVNLETFLVEFQATSTSVAYSEEDKTITESPSLQTASILFGYNMTSTFASSSSIDYLSIIAVSTEVEEALITSPSMISGSLISMESEQPFYNGTILNPDFTLTDAKPTVVASALETTTFSSINTTYSTMVSSIINYTAGSANASVLINGTASASTFAASLSLSYYAVKNTTHSHTQPAVTVDIQSYYNSSMSISSVSASLSNTSISFTSSKITFIESTVTETPIISTAESSFESSAIYVNVSLSLNTTATETMELDTLKLPVESFGIGSNEIFESLTISVSTETALAGISALDSFTSGIASTVETVSLHNTISSSFPSTSSISLGTDTEVTELSAASNQSTFNHSLVYHPTTVSTFYAISSSSPSLIILYPEPELVVTSISVKPSEVDSFETDESTSSIESSLAIESSLPIKTSSSVDAASVASSSAPSTSAIASSDLSATIPQPFVASYNAVNSTSSQQLTSTSTDLSLPPSIGNSVDLGAAQATSPQYESNSQNDNDLVKSTTYTSVGTEIVEPIAEFDFLNKTKTLLLETTITEIVESSKITGTGDFTAGSKDDNVKSGLSVVFVVAENNGVVATTKVASSTNATNFTKAITSTNATKTTTTEAASFTLNSSSSSSKVSDFSSANTLQADPDQIMDASEKYFNTYAITTNVEMASSTKIPETSSTSAPYITTYENSSSSVGSRLSIVVAVLATVFINWLL